MAPFSVPAFGTLPGYRTKAMADEKEFDRGWMNARAEALQKARMDVVVAEW